ncbi:hypothetical protein D3C87_1024440 [compost metagenome]
MVIWYTECYNKLFLEKIPMLIESLVSLRDGIGTINIFKTTFGMNIYKKFWLGYAVSRYKSIKEI